MALAAAKSPLAERKLRVLLDARKLGDGGIGIYIENLIEGLLEQPDIALSIIAKNRETAKRWRSIPAIIDSAPSYSLSEMWGLSRRVDFSKFDLFHSPHYTLPYGIKIPTVVTVHDLIHINHPERFYYPLIARPLMRSGVARASKVITVSHSSLREISEFMGAGSPHIKKISVVSNALDPIFLERAGARGPASSGKKPYILCLISNLKPHKGLDDTLSIFESLRAEGVIPADFGLVLAGQGAGEIFLNSRLHDRLQAMEGVECLGCVNRDDLAFLFRGAAALLVGSTAEGFCLPMLEAKASGIPVICRPVPALLELAGPADIVSSDFSREAYKAALKKFFVEADSWKSKAQGSVDLSKFDRVFLAKQVALVYRSLFSSGDVPK